MSEYHTPVLLNESVSALITNIQGTYVDATFGGGGHTSEILSRLSPEGRVVAFDRDSDAIGNRIDDSRLTLVRTDFRYIRNQIMLDAWNAGNDPAEAGVDGVLADLGVSSHQFDTAERGFSFRFEAPLDMRMNTEASLTAADVVNTYPREEIEKILRLYGEVDNPGRIARLIESGRATAAIRTTGDLDRCIAPAVPEFQSHKILAKIYQALRIEVNHEMRSLEKFLSGAAEALLPGGRLVVITYHSLEDRMVKNFIKAGNIRGEVEKDFYGNVNAPLRAVNRKPVLPSEEEISSNTRARSAKLRIAEKIGEDEV